MLSPDLLQDTPGPLLLLQFPFLVSLLHPLRHPFSIFLAFFLPTCFLYTLPLIPVDLNVVYRLRTLSFNSPSWTSSLIFRGLSTSPLHFSQASHFHPSCTELLMSPSHISSPNFHISRRYVTTNLLLISDFSFFLNSTYPMATKSNPVSL